MIGIDEVGRGAWAGPLLVCAARLKAGKKHVEGVDDSKKLSKLNREELYVQLLNCYEFGEGWISNKVIDEVGLSKALKCGALLALQQLNARSSEVIIIDGTVNFTKGTKYKKSKTLIRADGIIKEVSAASIYAKVLRDNYMYSQHEKFHEYGFMTNVGYGTKRHTKAIQLHGVTPLHRTSFKLPKKGAA